jgi:hypothetical protein
MSEEYPSKSTAPDRDDDELSSLNPTGFVLTVDDITIFKLIYEYRLLRLEHLHVLTGRSEKRLHRRIFKLLGNGFLTVIKLPQQKHIYGLGRKALPVLVEQGSADADLLTQRLRTHELKELFLKHEMMIVDLHVILAIAVKGIGTQLRPVDWREGRGLNDWVTIITHHGAVRLPIRPDAFFTLEDSRRPAAANRAHFFLEADRSTETQSRFTEKILAYWHYLEQGLHAKKFGIKNFRVLTVTITHERAGGLCVLAASVLPEGARKYFLFISLKHFSLADPTPVFSEIYLSPRSVGDRFPLVPAPVTSQTRLPVV